MSDPTANALLAAASCNTLLRAIDRIVVMVEGFAYPEDDKTWSHCVDAMMDELLTARGAVLDIKSRL